MDSIAWACRLIARKYEINTRNSKRVLFISRHQQNRLFIALDDLVVANYPYRELDALLSFDELAKPYVNLYSVKGRKEKGLPLAYAPCVLQFMEDMSDREMERFLQENNSG